MVRHARRHSCSTVWIAFHLSPLVSTIHLSIVLASASVYWRRTSCWISSGMWTRGSPFASLVSPQRRMVHGHTISLIWHDRSEEHTSELQSHSDLVCRLLLEKKNKEK